MYPVSKLRLTENMAVPILTCTREEQRAVARILWTKDVKRVEIYTRLCAQYAENALPW
jgi:hypothetical protein